MERKMESLIFRDCVYAQQALFFFSENLGMPVKYNLLDNHSTILSCNDRTLTLDLNVYSNASMYAVETSGKNLVEYNLKTNEYKKFYIGCNVHQDGNFAYLCCTDNKILIFTRDQQVLVIYDIVQETVRKVNYPNGISQYYIIGCSFGNRFLIFPQNGQEILEYDVVHNRWKIHHLAMVLNNCVHAMAMGDDICILLASGKILCWNYELGDIAVIAAAESVYANEEAASRLCITGRDIIVLPLLAQDIIRINRDSSKAVIYRDYPPDFSYDSTRKHWAKYYGYCENATEYYFACRTSDYILKIEKQSGEISWIKSEVDEWEIERACLEKETIINEKEGYLEWFITREYQENTGRNRGDIGKDIWKAIKK